LSTLIVSGPSFILFTHPRHQHSTPQQSAIQEVRTALHTTQRSQARSRSLSARAHSGPHEPRSWVADHTHCHAVAQLQCAEAAAGQSYKGWNDE